MKTSLVESASVQDEPVWMSTFFPNTAYVRLWRIIVRLFLLLGVLMMLEESWGIASEITARYTWPSAPGAIMSSRIQDDKEMRGKIVDRRHTHFWVEYEVRFAVGKNQCRTGIYYGDPPSSMPCAGKLRTRSTNSSQEAWQWMNDPNVANRSVIVLYNPSGPGIKIAGSSIWLFYPWTNTVLALVWVSGFWSFHAFLQRRIEYLQSHPEEETNPSAKPVQDRYKLTSLNIS